MDKIKTTRAICWISEWELLVYKRFRFAKYDMRTKKMSTFCDMPMSKRNKLLSSFKLLRRMLRLYPQSPCYNKITKKVYFSFGGCVYSLDLMSTTITNEVKLMHGASRVLSFAHVKMATYCSGNILHIVIASQSAYTKRKEIHGELFFRFLQNPLDTFIY